MRATRRLFPSSLLLVSAASAFGCNSVLGNEQGEPLDASTEVSTFDSAVAVDANAPSVDATLPPPSDAGSTADAEPTCPPGQKICFGQCVEINDPAYGCEPTGCNACKTSRASSVCAGGHCGIGTCDPGYFDCNQKAIDGCETDLSQTTHCGSCNAVCQVAAPYCAPDGTGFACSTNCPAQAPTLCGTQCVDLDTSESHCGNCNTPCPVVANGHETCVARTCQLTCDNGFHKCGGACVSNVDPATCGASCTPCTAPANAVPTCSGAGVCGWVCRPGFHACGGACAANDDVAACGATCVVCPTANGVPSCTGGQCGLACNAGFADCDKNAANGCEVNLSNDGAHCGTCTRSCGGEPCAGGACQPPPDAGPGDAGGAADADSGG